LSALRSWLTPGRWPWIAGAFAALMLAAAHAFQAAGYAPCTLCLRQREVYWVLLGVVAVRLAVGVVFHSLQRSPIPVLAIAAIFLFSAGLAGYHAGVEWKWWPGPETCAGGDSGAGLDVDDLSGVLSGEVKVRPPACDEAAWVFAGLSMAGWNAVASLAMFVLSLFALRGGRRHVPG
jgi:disulfide bond formation protein DsbB